MFALFSILISGQALFFARSSNALADSRPAEDRGAAGLGQAIRRLGVIGSALHTGAHPDDEDSGLLAYLARGRQSRTAYLSLTRGDGGQNLIGPELYESLGVIRTEELLAARKIDGAEQFFTRAFDFGFSKSSAEALSKWDRDKVLSDMVRVIRVFRPLVIVSAWTGTPSDGHGHHQAAGILTTEAFRAAADPARYPEQLAEGLRPWKAKKLYSRVPQREELPRGQEPPPPATLTLNKGQFDPLFGRSYFEIAAEGRSQHRSQDQGTLERRGPQYSKLRLLESSVGLPKEEKDIFENIDASLAGIADFAGQARPRLKTQLADAQKAADEALAKYNPLLPSAIAQPVARGLKKIREIRGSLAALGLSEAELYDTDFLLKRKESDFVDALAKSRGVVVDCIADDEIVTPGQSFGLSVQSYIDAGSTAGAVSLALPEGWILTTLKANSSTVDGRLVSQTDYKIAVASDAEITEPYWLKHPRKGDMFSPGKGGTGIEPNARPAIMAQAQFEIEGEKVEIAQPAQFRFADKALGEIRREVKVAPAISVSVTPDLLVTPLSSDTIQRSLEISVTNNSKEPQVGAVSLEVPQGVKSLETMPQNSGQEEPGRFELKREGERTSRSFSLSMSSSASETRRQIRAVAAVAGRTYKSGFQMIAYPHIETRMVYKEAKAEDELIDVKVARGLKVGYIEGAGDDFANALKRIGADVKTIESQEIASGDLSHYDTIVLGIRVYEVRPDVIANNARLLDYVKKGGTLIVQYNKNEIAQGNFTPFAVKMARGMPDRVTDEHAKVTMLEPTHPLFNFPNKITERDFEGWVQERGAYFFNEWDAQFKPLLSSRDQGEDEKRGGELIAPYGKGYYIYTAYAWFRQLPQGVPGAYRLIANLVSFPKANGL